MTYHDKISSNKNSELLRSYRNLFDSVTDAIFVIEFKGKIIDVNLGTVKMYGYEKNEIIGESSDLLNAPKKKYIEKFSEKTEKAYLGQTQRFRSWGRRKNGEIFPKDVILNKGVHLGREVVIATARDISKRIENEKKLIQAMKKAEDSDKIKSEFLAQISHEIRNPLNAIFSYTGLLKELIGEQKKDEYKDIFRGIKSASDRLSRTINSILDMVAIQSDMLEIELKLVNLTGILNNICKNFSSISHFKRLDFNFVNDLGDVYINGDEYTIYNLFENLVDNAFKYTSNGEIMILMYKNKSGNVSVDIKDTGIGISEKFLPEIFKPFSQETTGYSRKYDGNGLGLTLVKKYAELSKAKISVSSEVNKGSVFTVVFKNVMPVAQSL